MVKEIINSTEARFALKRGIDTLANAVKVTLGPKGKNVLLDKNYSSPHITKDGVTVATNIMLEDRVENMGCSLLKDIAKKTADEAGDGTTTSIVLAQALYDEGLKITERHNFNSIDIQKGMQQASKDIISKLQEMSTPVKTKDDLYNVATVSSNGDHELAHIISDIVWETGSKGNVIIQDSDNFITYAEYIDGIKFSAGYTSQAFCTSPQNQLIEYDNPLVLTSVDKISDWKVIERFVKYAAEQKRPLIIITEELVGSAFAVLAANFKQGNVKVAVVSTPGIAGQRRELLEDISIVTGGKLFGDSTGYPFHLQTEKSLGTCKAIRINRNDTTFFINDNVKEGIENRIVEIQNHAKLNDSNKLIQKKFSDRIANLKGKVAIIKVGFITETEAKEKKDRIDDAIRACQAAFEEGIIEGSGISYINAVNKLSTPNLNKDELLGYSIVTEAVNSVFKQVANNCNLNHEVILSNIKLSFIDNITGYNFRTDTYANLKSSGVIDPTKVLRVALENAVSITCQLLTTEAIVKNKLTEFDMQNINQPKEMVNPMFH